jgi:hypothetical protein
VGDPILPQRGCPNEITLGKGDLRQVEQGIGRAETQPFLTEQGNRLAQPALCHLNLAEAKRLHADVARRPGEPGTILQALAQFPCLFVEPARLSEVAPKLGGIAESRQRVGDPGRVAVLAG